MFAKRGHRHLSPKQKQREEKRKLREAEKKRQLKRDHLCREVKYGEITYKTYEQSWKDILIKVALPRMRSELEFAWYNFERVVDCKDFTISFLMDKIRECEEQYMHNFRAHCEDMEKLMNIFHDRLEELKTDFESQVKAIKDRCEGEFQSISETNNEKQNYLKMMLYHLELQKKEHMRLKKGEYFLKLDEVDAKTQLLLQKLKVNVEYKYQTIFDNMLQFIHEHNRRIKDKKKAHKELKAADDAIQQLIAHQFKQIKRLYDNIRQLKQQFLDMKQTEGSTLMNLIDERNYFSKTVMALKIKLENDEKEDFDQLALVSDNFAKICDNLEKLHKKGEMILSLSAVCRKLQTLKEKVVPFPVYKTVIVDSNTDLGSVDEPEGVQPEMELFWQGVGQASGVHYTLSRERKFLTEENQILIDTHNAYCENLLYPEQKNFTDTVTVTKVDLTMKAKKNQRFKYFHRFYSRVYFDRNRE